MEEIRAFRRWWPLAAHGGVAIGGFALLLLAPPAEGKIMLVPLTPYAAAKLPALAIDGGTRMVGIGPLPGSLIVYGDRATLSHLIGRAILPVASPPAGCLAATPEAAA